MGPAAPAVSVLILFVFITFVFGAAAFSQVEGDASGADGWRPLKTICRGIPLLVASIPPETASGAIGAAATPLPVIMAKCRVAAGAILCIQRRSLICRCANISAPPIEPPITPLAPIHALAVVREEEEEEREQQPAPLKNCSLKVQTFILSCVKMLPLFMNIY